MKKGIYLKSKCGVRAVGAALFLLGAAVSAPSSAYAQQPQQQSPSAAARSISGKVVDANGAPVMGATVVVTGTSTGTATDLTGNFTIRIPAGSDQLTVSYLGYVTMTQTIGNQSRLEITLTEDAQSLDAVVVVGYGTSKKETLTGAIAVIDQTMFQEKGTLASPLQAMQGQVPGVFITRSSAAPGDESWAVNVRGSVSVNSPEPLVIVDGVMLDSYREMRNISSDDIESVSFLKDASAAIYGSRGAGGVLLVTTKKAHKGEAKVTYNGSYSLKVLGLQPRMMGFDDWMNGIKTTMINDGNPSSAWVKYADLALANKNAYIDLRHNEHPIPGGFTDVLDFVFMDTNWTDILWGNAYSTQHDIGVSGGGEMATYRITGSYMYDEGTLRWGNNNNQRFTLRSYNGLKISKRFELESVISYSRQDQVSPTQASRVFTPSVPQPGLPASTIDGKPYGWGGQILPNWAAELGGDNKLKVGSFSVSETLKFKLASKLNWNTVLGYSNSVATRDKQENAITWYNYAGDRVVQTNPTQAKSSYEKTFAQTDIYSASSYLSYTNTFKEKHTLTATGGYEYNYKQYEKAGASVLDIQSELDVINGEGVVSLSDKRGQRNHQAVSSFFARANYDYKSKYLLEANARYDGSSKFQKENRWNFYYGFSAGWRISQENFMKNVNFINELKIRTSYGVVGNPGGVDLYDGTQLYNFSSSSGAYLGSGKASYIDTDGKVASLDRTWERIENYNAGIDFSVLRNRLSGSVDGFLKWNNNMLLTPQVAGILGDQAPTSNIGRFKAYGWEATGNWRDKIGEWSYHVGGVFSFARNNLYKIYGSTVKTSGFMGTMEGYPLNSYFGLRYAGKIQNEEQRLQYYNKYFDGNSVGIPGQSVLRVGDHMYEDVNKDGKLTYDDYVYLGTDTPEISYSFNLGVDWKGFDLSAIFQGVALRTIFRSDGGDTWRIPFRSSYLNTTDQSVGNVWSPETPNNHYPPYTNQTVINNYNYQASSWSVENGAYLRLKNLTFGYTLPDRWLKKMGGISMLRVYFTGSDLWEISKINDGWDPETKRTVSNTERYPFNRIYTFGVNLTF